MYETLITLFKSSLYFGTQMAQDVNIAKEEFLKMWSPMEHDRTLGKLSLEEALATIFREVQCFSKELLDLLVQKRTKAKEESLREVYYKHMAFRKRKQHMVQRCLHEQGKDSISLPIDEKIVSMIFY